MSLLTFAMSPATRNSTQTFSYFIPPNSVGDHYSSLSHYYRTTLMADYIIPVLIQQQNDCSGANPAQTPSCLILSPFCLSILKKFIPHFKIYRTSNDWQNAKLLYSHLPYHSASQRHNIKDRRMKENAWRITQEQLRCRKEDTRRLL